MHTNIVSILGRFFNKLMKPLFNISGEGSFAFIMGIISGYPVGAKIACDFRQKNICSKEECERLLSFTNNSGPLFVIGTVGISMFGSSSIGLLLFIIHLLAGISVGIIFRFWHCNTKKVNHLNLKSSKNTKITNASFYNLGDVLTDSIKSATSTIMLIGGFIVIFSSIISILNASGTFNYLKLPLIPIFNFFNIDTAFIEPILTGILEITNGISKVSCIAIKKLSVNIIIASFLLGTGGISVLLQVLSITSKTDLSIKPYILGKLLHGILSALYVAIALNVFPFINLDL